jgi:hypothetical protein
MEDFTNDYLAQVKHVMTHKTILKLFFDGQHS